MMNLLRIAFLIVATAFCVLANDVCQLWDTAAKEVSPGVLEVTFLWYGCEGTVLANYLPLDASAQPSSSHRHNFPKRKDVVVYALKKAEKEARSVAPPFSMEVVQENNKILKIIFDFNRPLLQ
jgi:hypothetical protein